ncbi:hypothetical protein [Streptomyces sp. NBC_01216]|uniref:trypsin-like serine peptidase n=1 Tax=unclassified Streptomyces TaxID=2593676 RepID=UPI002E10EB7B|nr:hypothetical protein OG393_07110 [Streptomyces sp. NBC_01216]
MRSVRLLPAVAGLALALTLALAGCGPAGTSAGGLPAAGATASGPGTDGGAARPGDLADRLRKRGAELDGWQDGDWRNWDRGRWLREAEDFVNPVIEGLWDPDRMRSARSPDLGMAADGAAGSDPVPRPVPAQPEQTPYHRNAAPVGKLFFDSPQGHMVCSGTVVRDPRRPGRSDLVWTAGHCVHAGARGGWYRNITFVPAYNDLGRSASGLRDAEPREVAPYGQFWADWSVTSGEWIERGGTNTSWPYDYAVLHVKPARDGRSLEETVGAALAVDFSAPTAAEAGTTGAWGYPAASPYDGLIMHKCLDRPTRLTAAPATPPMYRIGCTMTGGASGGGWFRVLPDGSTALVSNTSIGPAGGSGWLAGPLLGRGAQAVRDVVSERFAR